MDDEKLILEVEKNEILYDKSSEAFKDVRKKLDIWKEIGERIKCNGKRVWLTFYKLLLSSSGGRQSIAHHF